MKEDMRKKVAKMRSFDAVFGSSDDKENKDVGVSKKAKTMQYFARRSVELPASSCVDRLCV
jgi:hypothetical protein